METLHGTTQVVRDTVQSCVEAAVLDAVTKSGGNTQAVMETMKEIVDEAVKTAMRTGETQAVQSIVESMVQRVAQCVDEQDGANLVFEPAEEDEEIVRNMPFRLADSNVEIDQALEEEVIQVIQQVRGGLVDLVIRTL